MPAATPSKSPVDTAPSGFKNGKFCGTQFRFADSGAGDTDVSASPAFHWDDPLLPEQQLSPDERALRDATRDCCQGRLAPHHALILSRAQTGIPAF